MWSDAASSHEQGEVRPDEPGTPGAVNPAQSTQVGDGDSDEDECDDEDGPLFELGQTGHFRHKVVENARFNVLVLDEAQKVRDPGTQASWLAQPLKKQSVLLVSATPFFNTILDIQGVLGIVAAHAGLLFVPPAGERQLERLYGDDYTLDERLGDWQLFSPANLLSAPGLAAVRDAWNQDNNRRLWRLNPALLLLYCRATNKSPRFLRSTGGAIDIASDPNSS